MSDARVMHLGCGAVQLDDRGLALATCHRHRGHGDVHRGAVHGTGALTSWPEHHDWPGTREALNESTGTWGPVDYALPVDRDPLAGFWHAVAIVGAPAVYALVCLLALTGPPLVIVLWRAALA